MDLGKVFSDAWRTTFRNGAQWPFVAAMAGIFTLAGAAFIAIVAALLWRAFSAIGVDPLAAEQVVADPESLGMYVGEFIGSWCAIVVVYIAFGIAFSYLWALFEAGLAYSAGALMRGERPVFGETWRNAARLSPRVWGIQILAFQIPTFVLYMVVYYLTYALGFAGLLAAGEESTVSPEFVGGLCCGGAIALFVYVAGWAFFYSWSQLSIRHGVLWRQNAFESLGQGFQVLRARFGSVLLVLLTLLGASISGFGLYFVAIAVLSGVMPTDEVQICGMLVALLAFLLGSLAAQVFFSNLWTALVLRARPSQPGLPAEEGPPPPPPGRAPAPAPSPPTGESWAPPPPPSQEPSPSPAPPPAGSPLPPPPAEGAILPPPPPPAPAYPRAEAPSAPPDASWPSATDAPGTPGGPGDDAQPPTTEFFDV